MADSADMAAGDLGFEHDVRRRLISGLIVLTPLLQRSLAPDGKLSVEGLSPLLTSPMFAIVFVAALYVTGALVEILGDHLLARVIGNFVWAFVTPFGWFAQWGRPVRYALRAAVAYPAGIVLGYWYVPRAVLGLSDFRWLNWPNQMSSGAQVYVSSLPPSVNAGLQAPFGEYQELAWKVLQGRASPRGASWLLSLENRNRDVRTVLCSLVLAGCILAYAKSFQFVEANILAVCILVLGYVYTVALMRSTVAALEWLAIEKDHGEVARRQGSSMKSGRDCDPCD